MGILNYIKEQKEKFAAKQEAVRQKEVLDKAASLKDLREERLKLEGREKIDKLYAQEKARVDALKAGQKKPKMIDRLAAGLKQNQERRGFGGFSQPIQHEQPSAQPATGYRTNVFGGTDYTEPVKVERAAKKAKRNPVAQPAARNVFGGNSDPFKENRL